MSRDATGPSGLLLIDKPTGISSHDAVDLVRRALGLRRVGHAGTLDPMASGLLILGVGRATRLLRFLGDLHKLYTATGRLGAETTTLDAEGETVRESPVEVGEDELRRAVAAFRGEIEQVPPAFSAVKVGGEKLYRAARQGRELHAPPRTVQVFAFDLERFVPPDFAVRVECSTGTYVRSLVAGVGERLGCGAHVRTLRRIAIGPFRVEGARSPEDPGEPLPLERAVEHLPGVPLLEDEARAAAHGCCLGPAGIAGPYRATAPDGRLIGIWRDDGAKAVPEVVLAS